MHRDGIVVGVPTIGSTFPASAPAYGSTPTTATTPATASHFRLEQQQQRNNRNDVGRGNDDDDDDDDDSITSTVSHVSDGASTMFEYSSWPQQQQRAAGFGIGGVAITAVVCARVILQQRL